jgi:hypothetical protein
MKEPFGAVRYDGQYQGPLSSSRLTKKSDGELSVVGGKLVKKILQLVESMLLSPHSTEAF